MIGSLCYHLDHGCILLHVTSFQAVKNGKGFLKLFKAQKEEYNPTDEVEADYVDSDEMEQIVKEALMDQNSDDEEPLQIPITTQSNSRRMHCIDCVAVTMVLIAVILGLWMRSNGRI